MSRLFGSTVLVSADSGTPTRFVRKAKGRTYVYIVTEVLARWVESGQWWIYSPGDGQHDLTGERQVWRVEAQCGGTRGVYDLSHASNSSWRLLRIVD